MAWDTEDTIRSFDPFWGMRYAVVHDPDGTPVDLFAPFTPADFGHQIGRPPPRPVAEGRQTPPVELAGAEPQPVGHRRHRCPGGSHDEHPRTDGVDLADGDAPATQP